MTHWPSRFSMQMLLVFLISGSLLATLAGVYFFLGEPEALLPLIFLVWVFVFGSACVGVMARFADD